MNRACFPKEKTPEFTKMGEIHELFVLPLSLVWFAGATPIFCQFGPLLWGKQINPQRAGGPHGVYEPVGGGDVN